TKRFGPEESPNACLLCHSEKNAEWAGQQLSGWKPLRANAPSRQPVEHLNKNEAQLNYDVINAIVVTLASGICDGKSNLSFSSVCVNFSGCPLANRRADNTFGLIPLISNVAAGHSRR